MAELGQTKPCLGPIPEALGCKWVVIREGTKKATSADSVALGSGPGPQVLLPSTPQPPPSRSLESPWVEVEALDLALGQRGGSGACDRGSDRSGEGTCFSAHCLKVPLAQGMRSQNPQQEAESTQQLGIGEKRWGGKGTAATTGSLLFSFSSDSGFPLKPHPSAHPKPQMERLRVLTFCQALGI